MMFTAQQADEQRQRRDDLEVDDGAQPIRPTSLKCPAPAIPATSVAKSSGAMIIWIIRMKSCANGLMASDAFGSVMLTI
jgi:hypothetical protein